VRRRDQKENDFFNYHLEIHLIRETLEEFTGNEIEDGKLRYEEEKKCQSTSTS
jgi:hypothetical protein